MKPAPVIICPFSKFEGTQIAGNTPDEVAINLRDGTRIAQFWGARRRRPCPDLRAAFRGYHLSEPAKTACREVQEIYDRVTKKSQPKPQEALVAA